MVWLGGRVERKPASPAAAVGGVALGLAVFVLWRIGRFDTARFALVEGLIAFGFVYAAGVRPVVNAADRLASVLARAQRAVARLTLLTKVGLLLAGWVGFAIVFSAFSDR